MLKSRFEWAVLLLVTALLGGAWIVVSREPASQPSGPVTLTEAPLVGYLAPDFTLATPIGEEITLSEVVQQAGASGQPVVLNFWASWCAPCRIEMPNLQNASMKFNGRAAILGVNQGENGATITEFGNEFGITYPLLVDEAQDVNQLYDVRGLPTTVFIDADGLVREVVIGAVSQAVLESRVENLLAEAEQ